MSQYTGGRLLLPRIAPVMLLSALVLWHILAHLQFTGALPDGPQILLVMLAAAMSALAFLPLRPARAALLRGILPRVRKLAFGLSCIIPGTVHVLALRNAEPVFLMMGYVVLLLAYYDIGGGTLDLMMRYNVSMPTATWRTYLRMLADQSGKLAATFLLSVLLLYIGLMSVVGFTGAMSAAVLALAAMLALGLIILARRL